MQQNELNVYLLPVPQDIRREDLAGLLDLTSPEKRERIGRFYHAIDAARCLYADLLARFMMISMTGKANSELHFLQGENGKPFLADADGIYFNTSHSGDWVAAACGNNETGIDVEKIADTDLSVSRSFFSPNEHADIVRAAMPVTRFFDYWTVKESYIKFIGKGLSQPLNSFEIIFGEEKISMTGQGIPVENVHFRQYTTDSSHRLAVCSSRPDFPEQYQPVDLNRIIQALRA